MENNFNYSSQFSIIDTWSPSVIQRSYLPEDVCSIDCKAGRVGFCKKFIANMLNQGFKKVVLLKSNITGDTLLLFNKNESTQGHSLVIRKGSEAPVSTP